MALTRGSKRPNLEVAEADLLAVVLKGDWSGLLDSESVEGIEFAGGDSLNKIGRSHFKFHDLDAVQPLLTVHAANQNARLVELARWFRHVPGGNDQVV